MPQGSTTLTDAELVKLLAWILVSVLGLVGVLIGIMHNQMVKRLDNIDVDLKPVSSKQAEHSEAIKNLKEELPEIKQDISRHDKRIQRLELAKA